VSGDRLAGNLAATGSTLLWASSFPATEILLAGWHPLPLAGVRLALGSLAMLALAAAFRQLPEAGTVPWRHAALIGCLGSAGSVVCLITGQALSDPVAAAAIATSQPVVAAVMGYAVGRERLGPGQLVGIALAVMGALLLSPSLQAGGPGFRGGEPLLLLSVIAWTWYSRATGERLRGLGALATGGLTMAFGATLLLLLAGLGGAITPLAFDPAPAYLGWLLWMGVVAIGGSVPLWLVAVRRLGVTVASLHVNLAPFWVILLGVGLGGTIILRQVLGAAMIAAGAVVAQRSRRGR
jgi:drug/metabolite transporter (DMT)-like permease